jgi:Zn-dependent protease
MEPTERATDPSSGTTAPPADTGVTYEADAPIVRAELADPAAEPAPPPRRRRRIWLPIVLFVLTCLSTFLAGATQYRPMDFFEEAIRGPMNGRPTVGEPFDFMPLRRTLYGGWRQGLLYMTCVLAILFAHEMGHFVMTVVYRVRASLPFFIPLPISLIGTMGAVIVMDPRQANRRQIFDIGLAGPLAGLVVAIPIMWIGVQRFDFAPGRDPQLQVPLAMQLTIKHVHPEKHEATKGFSLDRANPWFMAGWVGLLVTGLNMLPVSQLDGGHVIYALFGKWAHWIARAFLLAAFGYMALMAFWFNSIPTWILMAILVLFIGTDHPPTSDDSVQLGWFRTTLGLASLAIPVFCFVPNLLL